MKKSWKAAAAAMLSAGILVGGAAVAMAGTSDVSYNTTVAPFNGSGYTGYQTKAQTNTAGRLASASVGGTYVVDARMNSSSSNGSWARNVNDNEVRSLPNTMGSGVSTRVHFSNDLNTAVYVQVTGQFRSN